MERTQKKEVYSELAFKHVRFTPTFHPYSRYNIVVTQRAKKDMSNAEKAGQKKLNQRTKLEHAKTHRKALEQRLKRKAQGK